MKICSFLPTGTTMLYALGLGDSVVGVTHECEFPPAAREKPVVLRSRFDPAAHTSAEINRLVGEAMARGESLYLPDLDLLEHLQPDLILTQEMCEVCAISYDEVAALHDRLASHPRVIPLSPNSLNGMLDSLEQVAIATGVPERGEALAADLRARVDAVAARTAGLAKPRVAAIEWLDPLFGPGHWVPELIELAGGVDGLGQKFDTSVRLQWEQVLSYQPEVIILMPCGFDVDRTEREAEALTRLPGWADLPAVQHGRVWAVWGHKYFSGAGPDLVPGLDLLAELLHPTGKALDPRDAKRVA